MKTLLYFEEYVSPLSKKIDKRDDIRLIKIRPLGSLTRNFNEEEHDLGLLSYLISLRFSNNKFNSIPTCLYKLNNLDKYSLLIKV